MCGESPALQPPPQNGALCSGRSSLSSGTRGHGENVGSKMRQENREYLLKMRSLHRSNLPLPSSAGVTGTRHQSCFLSARARTQVSMQTGKQVRAGWSIRGRPHHTHIPTEAQDLQELCWWTVCPQWCLNTQNPSPKPGQDIEAEALGQGQLSFLSTQHLLQGYTPP